MQKSIVQKHIVTGGLGFIGKHLVEQLLKNANNVICILDNDSRVHDIHTKNRLLKNNRVSLIQCDLSSTTDAKKSIFLGEQFRDAYVWHLAAINGTKNFYERPKEVLDVSINSIMNIVHACKTYAAKKLIVASSSEVYQQPIVIPTPEEESFKIPDPKNPRYSYAFGKMVSEIYTHHSCDNLEYVIFRPHNFYGSGGGYDHVIPAIIQKIFVATDNLKQKKCNIQLQGSGIETRAFCHINDGVAGIIQIGIEGVSKEVYHIGTQEEVSISELVEIISNILKVNVTCHWDCASPLGATTRRCPDISKVCNLGYCPSISLKNGLKDTVNWYLKDLRAHLV